MKTRLHPFLLIFALVAAGVHGVAQETTTAGDVDAEYQRVTQQRAAKIVEGLGLTDTKRASRVTDLIARQYQNLSKIHDARDARISEVKQQAGDDKAGTDAAIQKIRDDARAQIDQLHTNYLASLAAELSPDQVDKVKDGMTYGVAPLTYGVYLRMFPDLTDAQRKQVLDWLHDARELAMDEGSSKEKHGVFGKYKGRINNYLVKAGYDLKAGEANLRKPSPPAASGANSQ